MIIIKNTCVNQQSQAQMFMIKHIILLIKNKFKKFKKKFASGGEKLPIRVIDTPLLRSAYDRSEALKSQRIVQFYWSKYRKFQIY